MRKFLMALGCTTLLTLGGWGSADAALEGGNFTAVGNASTGVCTTTAGQTVDLFGNGVYDMVVALQREVGSPGSGSWEDVSGFTDVFPTASTQYRVRTASTAINQCFRLIVTTDTSGTLYYTTVTNRSTPTEWGSGTVTDRTHYRHFDDFQHGTLPITTTHNGDTPSYIVFMGTDGDATLAVTQIEPEGAIEMGWGDAGTVEDMSNFSFGDLSSGALVSDGLTVFETRTHMSQIAGTHLGMGLSDVIGAATEISFPDVSGITVTEGPVTTMADVAAIIFDTGQTTDQHSAVALNTNTLQNNADVYLLGTVPVATTYQIFRVEIDASGDCFFFVAGDLVGAMDACVATTAVLIPYIEVDSGSDAQTLGNFVIDYIDFWAARPAG